MGNVRIALQKGTTLFLSLFLNQDAIMVWRSCSAYDTTRKEGIKQARDGSQYKRAAHSAQNQQTPFLGCSC
jgi:hypothetical protein